MLSKKSRDALSEPLRSLSKGRTRELRWSHHIAGGRPFTAPLNIPATAPVLPPADSGCEPRAWKPGSAIGC